MIFYDCIDTKTNIIEDRLYFFFRFPKKLVHFFRSLKVPWTLGTIPTVANEELGPVTRFGLWFRNMHSSNLPWQLFSLGKCEQHCYRTQVFQDLRKSLWSHSKRETMKNNLYICEEHNCRETLFKGVITTTYHVNKNKT